MFMPTKPIAAPSVRSVLAGLAVPCCLVVALADCGGKSSRQDSSAAGSVNGGNAAAVGAEAGAPSGAASKGGAAVHVGGSGGGSDPGAGEPGGGAAGLGGDGNAGSVGVAGAAGAATGSCVNASGAGPKPWYDLTVVGAKFGADNGARVRIAVASQTPNRVGIADMPIVEGAFTASMPGVLNAGYYVGITIYVDRNDDDTCQPNEHLWDWTTREAASDMQFDVTPDQLCESTQGSCRLRQPTQQACGVGTGDTDLAKPLPCTP